ncbi:MAG: hypothetical protein E7195_00085 [Peptococcaceae bacterium]|nr:hypothetical protein [Peptococcaceae bacterium]
MYSATRKAMPSVWQKAPCCAPSPRNRCFKQQEGRCSMTKEQIAMLVRTAVLFLALLNQLLLVFGYTILPISEEELSELLSTLLTMLSALWVWWGEK